MESISFLTDPQTLSNVSLVSAKTQETSSLDTTIIRPRRRLGDTKEDAALGGLIQKTRAIQLESTEDAKVNPFV